ncbi:putative porin [Leptospira fluminis]|uniref:Putative porin n=1 Tax=Leptospira fluminis TaxID=2484979 RepID=A0A4R9GRA4_9LEPT|nr:putative porin [Leptospira fluminis]TGK20167.1 putative porin [Leptospira fluminis]
MKKKYSRIFKILLPFLLISVSSNIRSQEIPKKEPRLATQNGKAAEKESFSEEKIGFWKGFWSRSSATVLAGENGGQHIFESGTKYPNLSGAEAGSRITYSREFSYGGIELRHWWQKWELTAGYRSNGRNTRVGQGRDEDFAMANFSVERGNKFSFREWSFYDTPYTFSGTKNFADGRGRLKMKQDRISLTVRRYLGDSDPDGRKEGKGLFLTAGIHYTYFKYYLYDVNQWIASNPIFYGPIGIGLSFSNSTWEVPVGIGYRYSDGVWLFEGSFMGSTWFSHFRDYHYQRNLNFIGNAAGYGIETNIGGGRIWNSWLFFLRLTENRLYGAGSFRTAGGISASDILSNSAGSYRNYLSTKQYDLEFSITNYLEWISK